MRAHRFGTPRDRLLLHRGVLGHGPGHGSSNLAPATIPPLGNRCAKQRPVPLDEVLLVRRARVVRVVSREQRRSKDSLRIQSISF